MRIPHLIRWLAVCVLLATPRASAQDLDPALTERFSAGVTALKAGALDAAEEAFRDVIRRGGSLAFVHHNLGIVLQQRGRHGDALTEFRTAIRLDPSFGPAYLLAGTSQLALGRASDAVADLEHAVRLMAAEPLARLQLAEGYERSGDIAGVVDQYRELVRMSPRNDEYAYRLGRAYMKLAQVSFQRIQQIEPRSARLQQALGREYMRQERFELAARAFEEAAALDPTLPELHLALARIHLHQERLDEAERAVERELAIAPESAEAQALKAQVTAARRGR